jgi:hypothetical protein
MTHDPTFKNPSWWNDSHTSGWDRTKEALRRDWEQTKADLSKGGHELNQDVGDTVKQASGKQAIPGRDVPNPTDYDELEFSNAEPAMRYGYGARSYYGDSEWNDDVETKLRSDWESAGNSGSTWERIKHAVRKGWNSAKRAAA